MSPLFWDVMILAIIAFIGFLAIRNIYRDHKNGVPSCRYACGSACSSSCARAQTGCMPDGSQISKSDLRKIRRRIKAREKSKS